MSRTRSDRASMPADREGRARPVLVTVLTVGALMFGLALLGILTRPTGLLAAFWPANAVLLGLFVRYPRHATGWGWSAAVIGYLLADLLTGASWIKAGLLTLSNLLGVVTGYALYQRISPEHRVLRQPTSVIYLIVILLAASAAAGVGGMIANPILFDGTPLAGLVYWFTVELMNYLSIVPVMLTMPEWRPLRGGRRREQDRMRLSLPRVAPLLALVAGLTLSVVFSGPGALVYFIPGLLWCALSYSLFTTALLALLTGTWTLLAVSIGYVQLGTQASGPQLLESLRVGVTLICLSPLTVASVMEARNQLLRKLQQAATHDPLTGALNRSGFTLSAEALMQRLDADHRPLAVLMLDIDHFKRVNDTHGHAAGDRVLAEFSHLTSRLLRDTDVLGRFGGEEFVVLIPDGTPTMAHAIAQRICDSFAAHRLRLANGSTVEATVSIGGAYAPHPRVGLDRLLREADLQLYEAKRGGRNQVRFIEVADPATPA